MWESYRRVAGACLVVVTLFAAGSATAAEAVVGSVLAVRGTVFAESAGSREPLTANALVRRGDAIVSTAGKAKIALEDGSVVSVGENTRVRIDEYQRGARNAKARLALVAAPDLRGADSGAAVAEALAPERGWDAARARAEAERWPADAEAEGIDPARHLSSAGTERPPAAASGPG